VAPPLRLGQVSTKPIRAAWFALTVVPVGASFIDASDREAFYGAVSMLMFSEDGEEQRVVAKVRGERASGRSGINTARRRRRRRRRGAITGASRRSWLWVGMGGLRR
jgi:hypothetical protein